MDNPDYNAGYGMASSQNTGHLNADGSADSFKREQYYGSGDRSTSLADLLESYEIMIGHHPIIKGTINIFAVFVLFYCVAALMMPRKLRGIKRAIYHTA
jgi:hypothetical protein